MNPEQFRRSKRLDVSKLKRLLCYESQHQSQSNEKSLVHFDCEKAVSNYLGTQSTVNIEDSTAEGCYSLAATVTERVALLCATSVGAVRLRALPLV